MSIFNALQDTTVIIAWAAKALRPFVKVLKRSICEAMIIGAHWIIILVKVCDL